MLWREAASGVLSSSRRRRRRWARTKCCGTPLRPLLVDGDVAMANEDEEDEANEAEEEEEATVGEVSAFSPPFMARAEALAPPRGNRSAGGSKST